MLREFDRGFPNELWVLKHRWSTQKYKYELQRSSAWAINYPQPPPQAHCCTIFLNFLWDPSILVLHRLRLGPRLTKKNLDQKAHSQRLFIAVSRNITPASLFFSSAPSFPLLSTLSASVYTVVCLSIERLLHIHRPQWSNKVLL